MYDPYSPNFIIRARQTVFKWWYVVYKPVYILVHHGNWPEEKQAKMASRTGQPYVPNSQKELAQKMAKSIQHNGVQHSVDEILSSANTISQSTSQVKTNISTPTSGQAATSRTPGQVATSGTPGQAATSGAPGQTTTSGTPDQTTTSGTPDVGNTSSEIDTSSVDSAVLDRANEIMARLAAEAAEDEAKKQAEIENAKKIADMETQKRLEEIETEKRQAAENELLAAIMKKNSVDISSFVEEGKAHQNDQQNITIDIEEN